MVLKDSWFFKMWSILDTANYGDDYELHVFQAGNAPNRESKLFDAGSRHDTSQLLSSCSLTSTTGE